jgi:hypothetical protein
MLTLSRDDRLYQYIHTHLYTEKEHIYIKIYREIYIYTLKYIHRNIYSEIHI